MDSWFISLLNYGSWGMFGFTMLTSIIAAILSGMIGLEREMKGQPAGLRTHVIIAVACSLIMTISIFAIKLVIQENPKFQSLYYDASRIAAGILGGIGFMGAGAIVKNGFNIKGLTTAATLYFCAAIGMACGSGFVLEATGVTILILILMQVLLFIEKQLDKKSPCFVLTTDYSKEVLESVKEEITKRKLVIKELIPEVKKDEERKEYYEITLLLTYYANSKAVGSFLDSVRKIPGIRSAGIYKYHPNSGSKY